jgi:SAM-dependent methyltransferase
VNRHSILEPGNLLILQERERLLVRLLRRYGITSFRDISLLEAGCAGGYNLRQAVQWGARPENVAGVDLDPASVAYCQQQAPSIRVHCGSADAIPEPDASFDVALAFTLFSSVPDDAVACGIGRELLRTVRPGGLVFVYDMRRRNPWNPGVHPVARTDVERWFPGCPVRTHTLTLVPQLARPLGRRAPFLYGALGAIPPLRTHALHVVRRP